MSKEEIASILFKWDYNSEIALAEHVKGAKTFTTHYKTTHRLSTGFIYEDTPNNRAIAKKHNELLEAASKLKQEANELHRTMTIYKP